MRNSSVAMTKWLIKYGIWLLLAASIYMVLASEFNMFCFVSLPYSESTVEKLNGIGKNISLSYIAGVIFYVLSEYLPFERKKKFVQDRSCQMVRSLMDDILKFFDELCGQNDLNAPFQLYYDATQKEYNENDVCKLSRSQLLAIRKLIAETDNALNILLLQGEYLDEDDFNKLLKLKSESFLDSLRKVSQASDSLTIESGVLYAIISGVISMYGILNGLKAVNAYG